MKKTSSNMNIKLKKINAENHMMEKINMIIIQLVFVRTVMKSSKNNIFLLK